MTPVLPGVEIDRHVVLLSTTSIVVSKHACYLHDDILQLIYSAVYRDFNFLLDTALT